MSSPPFTAAPVGLPFDTAGFDRLKRPVWVFDDARKRKVYANPAAVELWGAARLAELLARDFSDQSASVRTRMEALRRRLDQGETVEDIWTFYPLGAPVRVSTTISAILLSDGRAAMLFEAAHADVEPEENRAVEALRHTPLLVATFDAQGRMLFDNPSHRAAFPGLTRFGEAFVERAEAERIWRRTLAEGAWTGSCRVRVGGRILWHSLVARRTPDPVTGEVSVLLSQADMTDEVEARLELADARAKAEEAMHSQEAFLANMSHELRTPLTSVLGFAGLLRDTSLNAVQARYLSRVEDAGRALMSTLNDVLDFSKLEAGGVELEARPFHLAQVLDQALGIVEVQAGAKDLTLRKTLDPTIPAWLMGDPERLRQILLNLLSNAVKFTAEGSVTLAARRLERAGAAAWVELSVTDTGVGVPEGKMDRVFERFTQADASVTRRFGGTGLGLPITKRLAEAMGGEVGVSSRLGAGSRFWCVLPFPVAEGEVGEAELAPQRTPAPTARVLVADDNAANRELVSVILEAAGCAVDVAADGAQAVAAVAAGDYDLVLMDVRMPVLDGVAATCAIRALPGEAARVPILALSANVLADQVEGYRVAGMNDHIAKPITPRDLLTKVAQWGGRARR
ncbi:MAG: response regulator [Caulobacter sp.]|nr:response regulator [Caulobacter sp.]